ncbi:MULTISPECIES: hypothetical protein [Nostocales]|jgi:hypothetical protein|uniref:hypothetical protein n=1 Tax=Nostocales TaxID=1161 RepID=UPI00232DA3A8|nr:MULTISPECIES: hypothetical protein [Aphanizomenonaceae]MDB9476796.1 hypothetical protein [Dolichospermum circinale CS-537/11]MDB9498569.1 hypothetical protein [Nodularia spumigena CS-336/02]
MNIRDQIRQLIRAEIVPELYSGTVKSVDTASLTCHVIPVDGSAEMPDVKIRGVNDGADLGVYIIPKIGANVVVAKLLGDYNNTVLLMCDSFESAHIKQPNGIELKIDATGNLELNGGQFGGLVKINQLVARLNTIEQSINQLKNAFTTWVPAPGDGGAALKIAITPYLSPISQTTVNSLENAKIKH